MLESPNPGFAHLVGLKIVFWPPNGHIGRSPHESRSSGTNFLRRTLLQASQHPGKHLSGNCRKWSDGQDRIWGFSGRHSGPGTFWGLQKTSFCEGMILWWGGMENSHVKTISMVPGTHTVVLLCQTHRFFYVFLAISYFPEKWELRGKHINAQVFDKVTPPYESQGP